MNEIYRSIWNAALGAWVAVAEITKTQGKQSRSGRNTDRKGGGRAQRPAVREWMLAPGPVVAALSLALTPLQQASAASASWDPNGAAAGSGGSGIWDATSTRWFNGTTFGVWKNGAFDDAVFNAPVAPLAGNGLTLSGAINAHSLTFNAAYMLSGGTLNLGGVAPTIAGAPLVTINSVITGTAGLIKSGTGVLTLNANNSYTGGTRLQQGGLTLGSARALGSSTAAADFDVSAGTSVTWSGGLTFNYNLTAHGGTVAFSGLPALA